MNILLLLGLLLAPPDAAKDVRATLDAQVAAWNRGDLAGFLAPYRHSEDLTFFSGGAVTKGFAAIQARYEKRYGTSTATMGRLQFEDLEVTILAPDAAFVRGRFRLKMESSAPTGLFTLLLRNTNHRWEIVHDHTSSE